jgi:molybdopterin/thiamine biosynthesis adenylyltransferase
MALSDDDLDRYARHIILREIGGPGQAKLRRARVLSIGAGGLGAPLLMYLAAAGVGTLGVVDDDVVDLSNLQRQVIHDTDAIGTPKTDSAAASLVRINPGVEVIRHALRLTPENAGEIIGGYDLVCDGSDNFDTRYLVNATCARAGIPLVAGAIGQWDGQLSLYDPARGGPCYACVFPERPAAGLAPSCAEAGVVGALPGVIGSMMAMEVIKHICGAGEALAGRLLVYDALAAETRTLTVRRDAGCGVCGE